MSKRHENVQNDSKGEQKSRFNRVIGACVAYLLIVLLVLIPTTLSSYISTTSGTDTARVARISLDTVAYLEVDPIKPGHTTTIEFDLSGEFSEVTQEYSFSMSTTGNLPFEYTLTGTATDGGTPIAVDGPLQFQSLYTGGILRYGEVHHYVLTITWDANKTAHQYANEIEYITITTQSVQVD